MTKPHPMTNFAVVDAMRVYGGSFMKAIAEAFTAADPTNFEKLKAAFPQEWKTYADAARLRHERGEGPA